MRTRNWLALVAALGALTLGVAACGDDDDDDNGGGGGDLSGTIKIDGSSTVAPLSEAAAELFQEENPNVRVTVGTSGTGGGFEKFCAGETDISDASRPIKDDEEVPICKENGVAYEEVQVANDGLAVVVNPDNDWAECLTVDQLKTIWDKGSKVDNWNEVDPGFPDEELPLFGAGTDSGTFDYFTDAINGEEGRSRSDYNATEDDNVTVQGVSGENGGLGYFGLSYALENEGRVKTVQVDGGDGCVTPSTETVQSGEYKPLSRPLFKPPSFGALPVVVGTLSTTFWALVVCIPFGLGSAIYLSEYARPRTRAILKPTLEVLAGIPTVVYGFFALTFVTPLLQDIWLFGDPPGVFNALSAGLVMGVMILPTVASLSEDAMAAVPSGLRQGAFALGGTKLQVSTRVVVPAALSGIVASFVLGISRAVGETMIVLIAAGGTPNLTFNPTEAVQTMTAFIGSTGIGDVPTGSTAYKTIFAVGASLFVATFVMNLISIRLVRKFREVYE